jgi:hypothetical protein
VPPCLFVLAREIERAREAVVSVVRLRLAVERCAVQLHGLIVLPAEVEPPAFGDELVGAARIGRRAGRHREGCGARRDNQSGYPHGIDSRAQHTRCRGTRQAEQGANWPWPV